MVAAVATLFSSFSSPFLTAALTSLIFIIGRSADTLAHIPRRVFGVVAATGGRILAHAVPNLQVYVPARALLLGNVPGHPLWPYVGAAAAQAAFYSRRASSSSARSRSGDATSRDRRAVRRGRTPAALTLAARPPSLDPCRA